MKKTVFNFMTLFTAAVFIFTTHIAEAQWRNETHDAYNAPTGIAVQIDGDLSEWDGIMDTVTGTDGTAFCGVLFEANGGDIKAFEEYNGGVWNDANDHETCFMFTWDENALYLALSVTDDAHEHAAAAAWNGDGAQLAVEPTGKREAGLPLFLYNIGLDGAGENVILQNENTNGSPGLVADDAAIVRDEGAKKTYYEFRFPATELQIEGEQFSEGMELGVGICVNDGDTGDGQNGQRGWDGWYPHAVVYGKNSEKTGLVILSSTAVTAVEPADKLTTIWGTLKSSR